MQQTVSIARSELELRRERVEVSVHSGEMEGLHVSDAGRADLEAYSSGAIDFADLVARARARYDLA